MLQRMLILGCGRIVLIRELAVSLVVVLSDVVLVGAFVLRLGGRGVPSVRVLLREILLLTRHPGEVVACKRVMS